MDIELVCIGREDFFYRRLERGQEGVHFLHRVDDSTLFSYYTKAKLLVVPSLMEGFGLPLLEAMNLSCPVVSSDTPALREVAHDAVIYFDPKRPESMVSAIEKVLMEPNLRFELLKKGLKRSKQFSWENCIDKTIDVYESCISV